VVGAGPVHESVDIDGFDPAFASGRNQRWAGSLREGTCRCCAASGYFTLSGPTSSKIAPQYDPTTSTVQLAAQLLFEEFCAHDRKPLRMSAAWH
jgi:guanidinopropionase